MDTTESIGIDALLTAKEVSEILGVNKNRIGDLVASGDLVAVMIPPSNMRKFRISDLNRYIQALPVCPAEYLQPRGRRKKGA